MRETPWLLHMLRRSVPPTGVYHPSTFPSPGIGKVLSIDSCEAASSLSQCSLVGPSLTSFGQVFARIRGSMGVLARHRLRTFFLAAVRRSSSSATQLYTSGCITGGVHPDVYSITLSPASSCFEQNIKRGMGPKIEKSSSRKGSVP